ncbi:MAG TPA: hypothetical protein EYQ73_02110 [Candidatus Poseidoniales archaeon]|jgi:hypothetical protein|nr:MAG: hypothetical protein CXT71_03005 [Euryarchaeota archaeon]HIF45573.1 hypothetical protein [Candidatus Poseidoniales archaeon]HIL65664.1 hypothetical protein [Candidatus Poseidoniales archaeon]
MEFSTIGAEDNLVEAKTRLENCECLIVFGKEEIVGVITSDMLDDSKTCGQAMEMDILVDPSVEKAASWKPLFIVITVDGEPMAVSRGA